MRVQPEIHVLGISLKSFGIVFACGFIAAGAILVRRQFWNCPVIPGSALSPFICGGSSIQMITFLVPPLWRW